VATAHLTHLNPFHADLGEVVRRYRKVLVPEMNLGQLSLLLRAEFLVDARGYSKVEGLPFKSSEVEAAIAAVLADAPLERLGPPRQRPTAATDAARDAASALVATQGAIQ
jgi:2-oxoglutarate ferredoxin oxidoreductase subunit alpha